MESGLHPEMWEGSRTVTSGRAGPITRDWALHDKYRYHEGPKEKHHKSGLNRNKFRLQVVQYCSVVVCTSSGDVSQ